ncbi:MAG: hypothetical protein OJF55_001741 [Rhodanobacteraceae bacterium]|jgi:hypothetical protein|nr:MAG: hypothetical protein OJF55_001741 [Rhodanobacteraceae bacterium]
MLNLRLKEVEPWTRGAPGGVDAILEARPC